MLNSLEMRKRILDLVDHVDEYDETLEWHTVHSTQYEPIKSMEIPYRLKYLEQDLKDFRSLHYQNSSNTETKQYDITEVLWVLNKLSKIRSNSITFNNLGPSNITKSSETTNITFCLHLKLLF